MTTEVDIQTYNGLRTVSEFRKIEKTDIGNTRVYYEPDSVAENGTTEQVFGPTDDGLFYEEHYDATIVSVRVEDSDERDGQLIV